MSDVVLNSEQLRNAASRFSSAATGVPTSVPLAMGAVSATDVTAAANSFNLWATYTALTTRAQLTSLAESTSDAAFLMEQAEAQLAAAAGTP